MSSNEIFSLKTETSNPVRRLLLIMLHSGLPCSLR
jgi:hypothetical protein